MDNVIQTGLGVFSKEKFSALLQIRSTALETIRQVLIQQGYCEVTTSSLVNIAGSCENPYASFTLNYYGRPAHLSQSAQLQLEALVIRLKQSVFSVNNSFREEHYEEKEPEAQGRRLSEFTLIEPEKAYFGLLPNEILNKIIELEELLIKKVITNVLKKNASSLILLGSDIDYLKATLTLPFQRISYDQALSILNSYSDGHTFGIDLDIREERQLLKHFNNTPVFITHYPARIKFFNMKRTPDGDRVYSVDLLTPRLGETAGGAVREENGEQITKQLLESKIATYIKGSGGDPLKPFEEYLRLFAQEDPTPRGGFGIGFERLIGFLLNSNDILETITYRSLQPTIIPKT